MEQQMNETRAIITGENTAKNNKGVSPIVGYIGVGISILNIILGIAGFTLIGYMKKTMAVNLAIMFVLLIGLFTGLLIGVILLVKCPKKGKGLFAVIATGVMLLFFAVDGTFLIRDMAYGTEKEGYFSLGNYPVAKPESNLTQADIQSDTVIWINATYAIHTYDDERDYRFIGGTNPDMDTRDQLANMLETSWGVTDRTSALACVERLMNKGHHSKYLTYEKQLKRWEALDKTEWECKEILWEHNIEEEEFNKYVAAYRIHNTYPENNILAWDYCRAIQMMGFYYVMDYVTLEECMDTSLRIAKELQTQYDSWEDMAGSYLLGYEFWKGEDAKEYDFDAMMRREAYQDIINNEPYIYGLDWNYPLVDTWSQAVHDESKEDVYNVVCADYEEYVKSVGGQFQFYLVKADEDSDEDGNLLKEDSDSSEKVAIIDDQYVEEQVERMNGNEKSVVIAGVKIDLDMQFKDFKDDVDYRRLHEGEDPSYYEIIYISDGKSKDNIEITLYKKNDENDKLEDMYIYEIEIDEALDFYSEPTENRSVLYNGIYTGSTEEELLETYEKEGKQLECDKQETYTSYEYNAGQYRYVYLTWSDEGSPETRKINVIYIYNEEVE